ncbi:hypothetical protein [Azospirillum argentinense]
MRHCAGSSTKRCICGAALATGTLSVSKKPNVCADRLNANDFHSKHQPTDRARGQRHRSGDRLCLYVRDFLAGILDASSPFPPQGRGL